MPYLSYAPLAIAQEEGYFADQGLEVEFVKDVGSAEAIPALMQGKLDVISPAISFGLLNGMANGARIKIVADKGYLSPAGCTYVALVARQTLVEQGDLQDPADLRGKRIAMNPVSFEGYMLEKILETAGLTLDDVETEDLPPPVQLVTLEKGTVDLVVAGEPWLTRMLQAGHSVVWRPAEQVIPDFEIGSVVYGPSLLDEDPDAGRRFMAAYLQAVDQYNEGKTERNLEILAQHTGQEEELLQQACWPSIQADGTISAQHVLDFQDWALEKGYLDELVEEDRFWDPSFAEHASGMIRAGSRQP
jgi:ABC-type nitrate/sulfonate/bicarbonate transport system substrate-binding protein